MQGKRMGFLKKIVEKPAFHTRISSDEVRFPEIALGYFLAPFCAMLANSIFGAYLTRYYADVLGWTKHISGAFAALLPIISVIFVVFGNLTIGKWIDNTRTKAGKARPYMIASIPLLIVAILLLFSSPNNGSALEMIWIALSYNLYYAFAYPCYYTAHSSMISLSTRDTNKRGLLATMSNAALVATAGVGASILVPFLLQSYMFVYDDRELDIAASYSHWRTMAIVLSLVTAAGILAEFYFTRERITEEAIERPREEEIPASRHRKACFRSHYWWMVMLYVLFFLTGQLIKNTSMSFYSRWMFESVLWAKDPEEASGALMSALGLIGGLPAALGMFIVWPLANRFGKQRTIITGLVLSLAGGLVSFLGVHDFKIVCAGVTLKAIGIVPSQFVLLALISDVLDHLEAENGFRSDGFTMSVYSAIMVGILGLAMGFVSGLLGLAGYDASLVRQPAAVEKVLILTYLGIDMIVFTFSVILLWKMDVEKYAREDRQKIRENESIF